MNGIHGFIPAPGRRLFVLLKEMWSLKLHGFTAPWNFQIWSLLPSQFVFSWQEKKFHSFSFSLSLSQSLNLWIWYSDIPNLDPNETLLGLLCISRLHFQTFTRQCARRCCHRRLKTATIEAIWNDFNQNWTRQKRFKKRSKHSSHVKIICHSRIWRQGTMVTDNSILAYFIDPFFLGPIMQL